MRDDFGIGLGFELEAGLFQVLAQFYVVLDDAVVNDGNRLARHMWVCVFFAGDTVCRPARMRDAD